MRHRQHTLHQVKFNTSHAWHTAQLGTQQPFLGRAIHLHDANGRLHTLCR